MIVSLLLLATLPWWPGGARGIEVNYPDDRIVVIDTIHGNVWYRNNLQEAIGEWNHCGANVHLVIGSRDPYTQGTITVFYDNDDSDDQAGPYGGWNGTAGIVGLAGGWTRSHEVIAHELGHALGFGHGGYGIMGDGTGVQPIDCEGLRNYYGS
jgi:hypothetical protein